MTYRTIVFFDLETTGLDTSVCHILQLAAICRNDPFNAYTRPRRKISRRASEVTGFRSHRGRLYRHGQLLETIPLYYLLPSFIEYLQSFPQPILLAAHNAKQFDEPVLIRVMERFNLLPEFQEVVWGFLDTLPLSRYLYPGLGNYSLKNLVNHFLDTDYNAHDAEDDSRMLEVLFYTWKPSKKVISEFVRFWGFF